MKTKTVIIFVMGFFLVSGFGFALNHNLTQRTVSEDASIIGNLSLKGISNYSYEEYENDDKIIRKLISNNNYKLPEIEIEKFYINCSGGQEINESNDYKFDCINPVRIDLTRAEILEKLDEEESKIRRKIANAISQREINSESLTLTREGDVILNEEIIQR